MMDTYFMLISKAPYINITTRLFFFVLNFSHYSCGGGPHVSHFLYFARRDSVVGTISFALFFLLLYTTYIVMISRELLHYIARRDDRDFVMTRLLSK